MAPEPFECQSLFCLKEKPAVKIARDILIAKNDYSEFLVGSLGDLDVDWQYSLVDYET